MRKTRYEIEGRGWLTIARAATVLGTNAVGVRKLMDDGTLEWRQTRANSRTFVVAENAVIELRKARPIKQPKPRRAIPPTPSFEPQRRVRGGLWQNHHLRMTLPVTEEAKPKKK